MRILVTAGATREPIDAVRFLTNLSSGATGATLADALQARGHDVLLLHGIRSVRPHRVQQLEEFSSARDLEHRLRRRLGSGRFDVVVMAAAVADYRPRRTRPGKLSSQARGLTLELVRNRKILPRLRRFSDRPLRVIGFKLTAGADARARQEAVAAQFAAGGVDVVVQNDVSEVRGSHHPFRVWAEPGCKPRRLLGAIALARELDRLLQSPVAADRKRSGRR